jgi:hypothetical protein
MTKPILALAAVTALLAACNNPTDPSPSDVTSVAPRPLFASDHLNPGNPAEANCHGQYTAYLAQFGKNFGLPEGFHAIPGVAARFEFESVAALHQWINTICNP